MKKGNSLTKAGRGAAGIFPAQQVADRLIESLGGHAGIDFEYCAVKTTHTRKFDLQNITDTPVHFEIDSDPTFTFKPTHGRLLGKSRQEVTITYTPMEAKVVISQAVLKFSGHNAGEATFKLKASAIGKYPFASLSQTRLDFGDILVGSVSELNLKIRNASQVPVEFSIDRVSNIASQEAKAASPESRRDTDSSNAFSLDFYRGSIPPGEHYLIRVKYIPTLVGVYSCSHFRVNIHGTSTALHFETMGIAMGYDCYLSATTAQFGEVSLGKSTNRIIHIHNDSKTPALFRFINDRKNVFSFSKTVGHVPAESKARIQICFSPTETMNYYERVFCIIKNHVVLYVDCIGTCYDILHKPMPLTQRHVDLYRHRAIMGMHNRRNLVIMQGDDSQTNSRGALLSHQEATSGLNLEIPIDDPNQIVLQKEMFLEMTQKNQRGVYILEEFMDFAFGRAGAYSEPKVITIVNTFVFPVEVHWVVGAQKGETGLENTIVAFQVDPPVSTIPVRGQVEVKLRFKPNEPSAYFFQNVQGVVVQLNGNEHKMRNLDLTDPTKLRALSMTKTGAAMTQTLRNTNKYADALKQEIDPPLLIEVKAVGHSFVPGSQAFIPMVAFSPGKEVHFPPCGVNESTYQTLQINNNSDTPVYYKMLPDPTKTFRSFPAQGMIQGQSFTLICFEFNPKSARPYNITCQCVLNHSSANAHNIYLMGRCYEPTLAISNASKIFFPPSYLGVSSRQKLRIQNTSRIPVEVRWEIPEKYKTEVLFDPGKLKLKPNEVAPITCSFTPLRKKETVATVPLSVVSTYDLSKDQIGYFNPGSGAAPGIEELGQPRKYYEVQVVGAGSDGQLRITPRGLEFGTVKVDFEKKLIFQLHNRAHCNIYVSLSFEAHEEQFSNPESVEGNTPLPELSKLIQRSFKFDQKEFLLNANSKKAVTVTFKPIMRFDFKLRLLVVAKENPIKQALASTLNQNLQQQKSAVLVHANGDYPLLQLADVRNGALSTEHLWRNFSVAMVNKELREPLSQSEHNFNNSDMTNQSTESLRRGLKTFLWDFGKILHRGSSSQTSTSAARMPRRVVVTIRNTGGVDAEWSFKLPNDSEIDIEPWADPGDPTPEQEFEKHILDHGIFSFEPRAGVLGAGEQLDIVVCYYPKEVGRHHLSGFFQIAHGKPMVIKLAGETLSRRAHLELAENEYQIPPMPLNLNMPVTYPLEFQNIGGTKLKYEVDCSPLTQLNSENHEFSVMAVDNPVGVVKPGDRHQVYVLFRPLESKLYETTLPLKVTDIEGVAQNLQLRVRGRGFHPDIDGDKQNAVMERDETRDRIYKGLPLFRQRVSQAGSLALFSMDALDFGSASRTRSERRFLILENVSGEKGFRFEFQKTGLVSSDELSIEPFSGLVTPNSHVNIKFTLTCSRVPIAFQGQICCRLEWLRPAETVAPPPPPQAKGVTGEIAAEAGVEPEQQEEETLSAIFAKGTPIGTEDLFIRVKKMPEIEPSLLKPPALRIPRQEEGREPITTSIFSDCLAQIFEELQAQNQAEEVKSPDTNSIQGGEQLLNHFDAEPVEPFFLKDSTEPVSMENALVKEDLGTWPHRSYISEPSTSQQMSRFQRTGLSFVGEDADAGMGELEDLYEEELKQRTGAPEEELFEKRMLVQPHMKTFATEILESTLFNILQEATFQEFDLCVPPKTFIRGGQRR